MNKHDFINTLTNKMTSDPNLDKQVSTDLNIDEGMPQTNIPPSVAETTIPPSVAKTTITTPLEHQQEENLPEPQPVEPQPEQQPEPQQPQPEPELQPEQVPLQGEGRGLMTNEIDEIMKKYGWYLGAIASDEIYKLKPGSRKRYGFIMNLDNHKQAGSHWISVWISLDKDRSVEVYDPLARYELTEDFQQQMKQLIGPDSYLLMKVNQVKQQSNTSDTCGWFAMRFLIERSKGNRFEFASGYTDLKEDGAEKLKAQHGYGHFDTYM